jgi:hypothetical protein
MLGLLILGLSSVAWAQSDNPLIGKWRVGEGGTLLFTSRIFSFMRFLPAGSPNQRRIESAIGTYTLVDGILIMDTTFASRRDVHGEVTGTVTFPKSQRRVEMKLEGKTLMLTTVPPDGQSYTIKLERLE